MHGLAVVADDDVLHHLPHDVIQNGDAEQAEAVGPGDEDGADDDERDARGAVEILLNVKLIVRADRASFDDRVSERRNDFAIGTAPVAPDGINTLICQSPMYPGASPEYFTSPKPLPIATHIEG